jgi:hypothetical protein
MVSVIDHVVLSTLYFYRSIFFQHPPNGPVIMWIFLLKPEVANWQIYTGFTIGLSNVYDPSVFIVKGGISSHSKSA